MQTFRHQLHYKGRRERAASAEQLKGAEWGQPFPGASKPSIASTSGMFRAGRNGKEQIVIDSLWVSEFLRGFPKGTLLATKRLKRQAKLTPFFVRLAAVSSQALQQVWNVWRRKAILGAWFRTKPFHTVRALSKKAVIFCKGQPLVNLLVGVHTWIDKYPVAEWCGMREKKEAGTALDLPQDVMLLRGM